MITRRDFLKYSAIATAATTMPFKWLGPREALAFQASMNLTKFTQRMREFLPAAFGGTGDIPLAAPAGAPYAGMDFYNFKAVQYTDLLHPQLVNPTRLYGYQSFDAAGLPLNTPKHLSNAILAFKDKPVRFSFASALPATHIIPFDATIPTAPGIIGGSQNRAAVHLHGGLVPWASDGGPFHWVDPAGTYGASAVAWLKDSIGNPTYDYLYPNKQSARLMWYHDHAIGTTRTTAYAGLATGYILYDPIVEAGLPVGEPIVFQDKVFYDPAKDANAYGLITGAGLGDLFYPYIYDPAIWAVGKGGLPLPVPSCVAEMFGDTMLANGLVYPFKPVNGQYRFRLLNACNARFLQLQFVLEDPLVPGEPLMQGNNVVPANVTVTQIGTEGGFLQTPVALITAGVPNALAPFLLGPAERADIIVDFSALLPGTKVILYNDAPAPFPGGAAIFDYYPGNKKTAAIYVLGSGPNTRTIMQFRVDATLPLQTVATPTTFAGKVSLLPTAIDPTGGQMLALTPGIPWTDPSTGKVYAYAGKVQNLTLNEVFDDHGRLMQLVGTTTLQTFGLGLPIMPGTITYGQLYADGLPSEKVQYDTIETWNVFNLTADTHPMHFHLFNVQVLQRRPVNVRQFNGIPNYNKAGVGPDLNEIGMKETVKMNPGEGTRVGVLIEDPMPNGAALGTGFTIGRALNGRPTVLDNVNPLNVSELPPSPRLAAYGVANGINWTNTDEYVWHCHILEHEEHDMMRVLGGAA